ncbi:bifunctional DNA primase/polymerase [Streptomyces peucetius]
MGRHGVTDGPDVLAVLCERHGRSFPAGTYAVRTWSGDTHLYFLIAG